LRVTVDALRSISSARPLTIAKTSRVLQAADSRSGSRTRSPGGDTDNFRCARPTRALRVPDQPVAATFPGMPPSGRATYSAIPGRGQRYVGDVCSTTRASSIHLVAYDLESPTSATTWRGCGHRRRHQGARHAAARRRSLAPLLRRPRASSINVTARSCSRRSTTHPRGAPARTPIAPLLARSSRGRPLSLRAGDAHSPIRRSIVFAIRSRL